MKLESTIGCIENMEGLHEERKSMRILFLVKNARVSMIGGWIKKHFIAPMTFTGGCDKEVFNAWLERVLLPQLGVGIMDNATFHKTPKTKELIESAGCHLLNLPTYSPD